MIIFVCKPHSRRLFCTFDTEKKIYHTEPMVIQEFDMYIPSGKVDDVQCVIYGLEASGFKKVSREVFLKKARHSASGLPLHKYVNNRLAELDKSMAMQKREEKRVRLEEMRQTLIYGYSVDEENAVILAKEAYKIFKSAGPQSFMTEEEACIKALKNVQKANIAETKDA